VKRELANQITGTNKTTKAVGLAFALAIFTSIPSSGNSISSNPIAETPIQFFTNVASRLLQSEFKVDLHHIPSALRR